MTVYIDNPKIKHARRLWCHMMADSLDELHDFAVELGLKKSWFQGDHYDLVQSKRNLALKLGAKAVSSKFLVELRNGNV